MKKIIIYCDYKIKNIVINLLTYLLFKRVTDKKIIHKILIFRTGSIGDNICALPAINSIRQNFKDAEIHVLTNSGGTNLVSLENLIDKNVVNQIINYLGVDKKLLFKNLKNNKYDLFIELPQTHASFITNVRNIFICKLLGIKYAFGWQVYSTHTFKRYQEQSNHFINESVRLTNILKSQNLMIELDSYPLALTIEHKLNCENIFLKSGVDKTIKCVGIIAGAKRQTNRWPVERYNLVVKYLTGKGYNVFLIGGEADNEINDKIDKHANVYNFSGMMTPLESAYTLSQCSFVISNDTGPLHLAYAVGTPVIALFSCRDYPKMWYPPTNNYNTVLRAKTIECSLCLLESCPNNNNCLKLIEVDNVIDKVNILRDKLVVNM